MLSTVPQIGCVDFEEFYSQDMVTAMAEMAECTDFHPRPSETGIHKPLSSETYLVASLFPSPPQWHRLAR